MTGKGNIDGNTPKLLNRESSDYETCCILWAFSYAQPLHTGHCYPRQTISTATHATMTHPHEYEHHLAATSKLGYTFHTHTSASNSNRKFARFDHRKGESSHSDCTHDEKTSGKYFSHATSHPRLITCKNTGQRTPTQSTNTWLVRVGSSDSNIVHVRALHASTPLMYREQLPVTGSLYHSLGNLLLLQEARNIPTTEYNRIHRVAIKYTHMHVSIVPVGGN